MFSKPPVITNAGKTLLLRAAGGEQITFTRFQAGSGWPAGGQTEETMTALSSVQVANIAITKSVETEEGYIQLVGGFDNQNDVQADFVWSELGLLARVDNPDADDYETEYLYAYGYDGEYAEMIHAGGGSVVVEQTVSLIVAIGDSGNITANISENITYASKASFDAHVALRHAHGCTYSDVGAAAAAHNHSTDNITSGILPAARGGTGVGSLQDLADALSNLMSLGGFVFGTFTGDGKPRQDITTGFQPAAVVVIAVAGGIGGTAAASFIGFSPGKSQYHSGCGNLLATDISTILQRGHGGAGVTSTGFAVGWGSGGRTDINVNGTLYAYIAFK